MHLVCPKCAARYEVPEQNIPSSGRDVQCSACGYTWFQAHPSLSNFQEPLNEPDQEINTATKEIANQETGSQKNEGGKRAVASELSQDTTTTTEVSKDGAQQGETSGPALSRLHPTVAEVLKEEARREVAVRAAESLETQPDLGVEEALLQKEPSLDAEGIVDEAVSSIPPNSDLDELERFYSQAAQKETSSRDDLLPDIEEINSSLNSGEKKKLKTDDKDKKAQAVVRKRMKRLGLLTGVLIVVFFFGLYQFDTDIDQAVPQIQPLLDEYIQLVDRLRVISDHWVARAIAWLEVQAETARGATK